MHESAFINTFRHGITDELVQPATWDIGFENLDIHFFGHFDEVRIVGYEHDDLLGVGVWLSKHFG
jgi:hypothetical protein